MKSKRRIDTDIEIAIVQIAMMIAGLDGNVSPEEYVVFEDILGLCGCAPERVKEVFDMGLESAGYVVLQSQRLPEDELIDVFVYRAKGLLPGGFKGLSGNSLRRAFMTWTVMAMSDNDFSDIERHGICALMNAIGSDTQGPIITKQFLEKCEHLASKLLSAQKLYSQCPTRINKSKCESMMRRINGFLEVR